MSFPRYPTYKDSGVKWLGQVPVHWDVIQFKHFVDIQNGSDHKHVEQAEGYPVFGSGGIFTYASDFLYDGESVLLGRKGTIDKPLHITGRFWTVDTMYWTKINPAASGRFTYYSALTIPFDYYSTNTALPSMTKGALNSHLVVRPPLTEQTQIATFLDRETAKIDGLVAEQRQLMELLKEKRQAVISHAVTRGLNPDSPMKPSGVEWLGYVPAHWEIKPLKYVGAIVSGYAFSSGDFTSSGIRVLKIANIQTFKIDWSDDSYLPMEFFMQHPKFVVNSGDVVFALTRPIISTGLKAAVIDIGSDQVLLNQRNALFRPFNGFSKHFVYQVLFSSSFLVAFENKIDFTGQQPNISPIDIGDIKIPVPPLVEQVAIAEYVGALATDFDTLTAEAQHAIDLLQERRTALISAAVTGQIDVREFA